MAEKRYYWLKLKEDYFSSPKIKKLRKVAGGDTFTIIYLKMQLLSIKTEGYIEYEGIEPTFEEEIALKLDEDIDNVSVTLSYLKSMSLLEESDEINKFFLIEASNNVGSEGQSAERKRRFDEKKKLALQSNASVTEVERSSISISNFNSKSISLYDILKEYNFSFEIEEKINEWLTYKKEKKQSYKPTGFKTLLKNIQNAIYEIGEQAVLDSIDNCIASNYSGLFFNKKNKSNNAIVSQSKKQNDQFLDWCAEAYEILEGQ